MASFEDYIKVCKKFLKKHGNKQLEDIFPHLAVVVANWYWEETIAWGISKPSVAFLKDDIYQMADAGAGDSIRIILDLVLDEFGDFESIKQDFGLEDKTDDEAWLHIMQVANEESLCDLNEKMQEYQVDFTKVAYPNGK